VPSHVVGEARGVHDHAGSRRHRFLRNFGQQSSSIVRRRIREFKGRRE